MEEKVEPKHIPHKNIAYHMDWEFRREAVVWAGDKPVVPNLHPLATELRDWMLRKGNLTFFAPSDKKLSYAYTNPYTYDGSILAITFAQIVNDSAAFVEETESIDFTEVEIKRIRLYTEQVLYTARLCEAFIKQLLFCTTFPEGDYRRSALGSLLSKKLNDCRNSKDEQYKISLLGSLAHRYSLCNSYEQCLNKYMTIVERRRNVEAAHSGVTTFTAQVAPDARKQLGKDISKIGDDFVHMLQHISDIEKRMIAELKPMIAQGLPSN